MQGPGGHQNSDVFRVFVQTVRDYAMFLLDTGGLVLTWNAGAERIYGYREDEVVGRPFSILYPSQDIERGRPEQELRSAASEGSYQSEGEQLRKDGSRFRASSVTTALRDETGRLSGFACVTQDISKQSTAEAALHQGEGHYRQLVELSPCAICVLCDNRIVLANRSFQKLLGASRPDDLIGRPPLDLIHPDYHALFTERMRQLWDREEVVAQMDAKLSCLDGSVVDAEVLAAPHVYEGKPATQVTVHDLTTRCRVPQALLETESKYKNLVEKSLVGVYLIQEGQFVYVNPKLAEIFGYQDHEVMSRPVLELVAARDRALVEEQLRRRTEGSVQSLHYTFTGIRKDEHEILVEVHGSRTDYQGKPAVIGTLLDITEKSVLENQLRQSQKMEAVGRLAGGIAHDFNNLLTAIIGYSELLVPQFEVENPVRKDIEEIQRAGKRAANLTRQLLAFSRKQVLQPKVLDLNQVIGELEPMLRRLIGEDIELRTLLGGNLHAVKVDPGQIEQIVMNLAINSRDAMPQGGKLTIETSNVELDDSYSRRHVAVVPGSYVMLAVSDTGCGMDAETQSHIFEPFFTTKEPGKGTGLGLSTVYGIVKQSGGNIWVYSELGKGTVFKIYLPRVEELPGVDEARPQSSSEKTPCVETILVVEDEPIVRNLVRDVLRKEGYVVLEAQRGLEAVEMVARHQGPIHLLLTDVVVPQMGGHKLAGQLTRWRPDLRIVYMSGYTDSAIVHHGLLQAGTTFLQKPFTPEVLLAKVRQALSQNR
ncbi:MAG: PAS domain S-box protein [Acidobacteriota bacterium]